MLLNESQISRTDIRPTPIKVSLSPLELAVLRSIASGLQSKEMGVALKRSKPTVERHVRSLFAKFGAKSRAHLVAIALHRGILEYEHLDLPYAS